MSEAILALKDVAWASAGVFLALISGSIAVYGGVRFGLIPGVKGLKRSLEKIEAASELIDAQMQENHGSSLIDGVRELRERVESHERLTRLTAAELKKLTEETARKLAVDVKTTTDDVAGRLERLENLHLKCPFVTGASGD
jgi:hypothetical protein